MSRELLKRCVAAIDVLSEGKELPWLDELLKEIEKELGKPEDQRYRIEQSLDFIENYLREEIAELQGKYDELLLKYTNELRNSYNLQIDINELKAQLEKQRPSS